MPTYKMNRILVAVDTWENALNWTMEYIKKEQGHYPASYDYNGRLGYVSYYVEGKHEIQAWIEPLDFIKGE